MQMKKNGFTLVECLIALVVLGLLVFGVAVAVDRAHYVGYDEILVIDDEKVMRGSDGQGYIWSGGDIVTYPDDFNVTVVDLLVIDGVPVGEYRTGCLVDMPLTDENMRLLHARFAKRGMDGLTDEIRRLLRDSAEAVLTRFVRTGDSASFSLSDRLHEDLRPRLWRDLHGLKADCGLRLYRP